ncbi:unnamed protein product [Brachionus calyciflorus]|uniref:RNA cytidine acetyltransferase n=1 Tax=Brachionus calyciflorus TaxID=104777 RepID=A0A813YKF5_9BILA|nr:unnamed protein product [Brachionus calyciflorus]
MVKKKIDNRIRVLIENGIQSKHRSMFVVVGDKARDQCVILHHMLSKSQVKARPNVLWCYKKDLGFSSHRKKRMKQIQKKIKCGKLDINDDDPFELFVASTTIRYCYYNETHKILGNTFGMLILQDFEAITPNLLARTIETVEGGGLVVILLRTMDSLKQFYTMSMDVHSRFRTEAHQDLVARFNERFILSLATNPHCLVVDDQLNILPISSATLEIQPLPPKALEDSLTKEEIELRALKESLQDTQPAFSIVNLCKTLDQAKAILKFIDSISEKTLRSTVTLTASRGRGKSAALGLAISAAIAYGYSNIFVTSPTPENLKTLFEFVFKGFDSLDYQEHVDYELIQSTNPEFNNAIIRVNVFKEHRQTIQYIHPGDAAKLGQAELLIIDEAAAIPLPLVKNLLGPYLVFMASTINGYEGTGRSLSLKLIQQLRQQSSSFSGNNVEIKKQVQLSASGKILHELQLNESIRYGNNDPIEKWLNDLLCLNCCQLSNDQYFIKASGCPLPDTCELFYVNRDTLFSYHKVSELFLQRLMSLYVSSHYKNTPNDLQMLSDAPAHHIFCLLSPVKTTGLPEILCVVQVCLEGEISRESVIDNLQRGKRASGDLIPWTVSQQFQDNDFPRLAGGRIVRIATHPEYQGMGYGQRAMNLLKDYYEGKMLSLNENEKVDEEIKPVEDEELNLLEEQIEPKKNLPPLLLKLSERRAERLSYLGVSFGLTSDLLRFWKKLGFLPAYLRQTPNELTGEHSCIVLKELNLEQKEKISDSWLYQYFSDFRRRFISLLSYQFRVFLPSMGLSMMKQETYPETVKKISKDEADLSFNSYDFKRLEMYALNLVDYHLVIDLVPEIARLYFMNKLGDEFNLSLVQSAILIGVGLQKKSVEDLEKELQLPPNQLLAMFNKVIKKFINLLEEIQVNQISKVLFKPGSELSKEQLEKMEPLKQSLEEELNEASAKIKQDELEKKKELIGFDLKQYEIKGSEKEWTDALKLPVSGYVTVKHMSDKRKVDYDSHFDSKEQNNDDFDKPNNKKNKKNHHGHHNNKNKKNKK